MKRQAGFSAILIVVAVAVLALAGVAMVRVNRADKSVSQPSETPKVSTSNDLSAAEQQLDSSPLDTTDDEKQLEADLANF